MDDFDTDIEVGGEGRERCDSLPTLLILLGYFSICAQMNLATGRTNPVDARARLVKVSMNVEDLSTSYCYVRPCLLMYHDGQFRLGQPPQIGTSHS